MKKLLIIALALGVLTGIIWGTVAAYVAYGSTRTRPYDVLVYHTKGDGKLYGLYQCRTVSYSSTYRAYIFHYCSGNKV
jgi:hypothetical protein